MNFLPEEIEEYAQKFSTQESDLLAQLNRETNVNIMVPQMLSGHIQGNFLKMMSYMILPKRILEVGTYTGYSAICLAEGLSEDGLLHTIDVNEELKEICNRYFKKSGFESKIKYHLGNALEIIPTINEYFDMVFIDADKENYSNYFDMVFDQVKPGGFIIADNVLWSGKVCNPIKKGDKDTAALQAFNEKIQADPRVENYLLPIRDGLMVIRKV